MWHGDSGICLGRPVTITTQETIAKVLAASLLTEEFKALYCREVAAHWVPKPLDLIRNGFSTTCQGRMTA